MMVIMEAVEAWLPKTLAFLSFHTSQRNKHEQGCHCLLNERLKEPSFELTKPTWSTLQPDLQRTAGVAS
jgi:hypothetical protein